ncbi:hypothetical protein G3A56_00135 [Rhizobium oryzihabitans]|uniref:Uncharacterized protein n=1 Tax=Rhizobium oryzihabitans TaxID=2267833 RepID=A0A7L5BCL8_9HYPH|nr:hypothetical protein [Rhizobium oryzihabitans]QIB36605.1 hypothetical protein G3A56_00135 [Rhizobium oryzihabitans]
MRIAGFEFAEGARFQPGAEKNAKLVGEHIEMLRKRLKGELTPQDVLDDARHDNSPLHSFFEWNDGRRPKPTVSSRRAALSGLWLLFM